MNDSIIRAEDIYIQDIVQEIVFNAPPGTDDMNLYVKACDKIDVTCIEHVHTIFQLIKLNKEILKQI